MESKSDINPTDNREGHRETPCTRTGQPTGNVYDVVTSGALQTIDTGDRIPCKDSDTVSQPNLSRRRQSTGGHDCLATIHIKKEVPLNKKCPTDLATSTAAEPSSVLVKKEPDWGDKEDFTSPADSSQLNLESVQVKEEALSSDEDGLGNIMTFTVPDGSVPQYLQELATNRASQGGFVCLRCNLHFSDEANLLDHWKSHKGADVEPPVDGPNDEGKPPELFICTYLDCQRHFINKAGLKTHQKSHKKSEHALKSNPRKFLSNR